MNSSSPVVMGLVGLGGWAANICKLLESQSSMSGPASGNSPPIHLAAVCEPDHQLHAAKISELRRRGVKVFERYEDLLATPINALWLPLPIDLHRPFTEKALAAGKAVMCEKPVAGTIDDVNAMIAARDRARLPVCIAFPDIYDPTTLALKRRLLDGLIGPIRRASVLCCWPRSDLYITRNDWAGRLRHRGAWVLDSPAQNAMAHYFNIALFLMGPTPEASALLVAVEAELYRVNAIENYDTISMRLTLDSGATLLVNFTLASQRTIDPEVVLEGDKGTITRTFKRIVIEPRGQRGRQVPGPSPEVIEREDPWPFAVRRFAAAVLGRPDPDIAMATLENSRSHTIAVNGASQAAPIVTLPGSAYQTVDFEGGKLRAISGIEDLFSQCSRTGKMLHESGLAGWTSPSRRLDLHNYRHFAGLPE